MKYLLLTVALFAADALSAQTADDIINKHFEATGGKDKWAKVYSLHYTGNYLMGPGMEAPVTGIVISKPYHATYNSFTWQGMTNKTAIRADSGWTYNPFGGKRETDPLPADAIRAEKLTNDPQGLLFNYKEKGYTVDYLGMDDMDGTDVYKLRLTTRNGDMVYYFLDAESYYILKTAQRVKLKDKEQKSYSSYSDFRKTDYGVIVAFSHQSVDENGIEQGGPVNFSKIEVNGAVDLTLFDRPKN